MSFGKTTFKNYQILLILALLLSACTAQPGNSPVRSSLDEAATEGQNAYASDFALVTGPRLFSFPLDFGPHPEYQTEWWYYTGNLQSGEQHFGYQLTFFRRGLLPPQDVPRRESDWATSQVYMAHFALTNTYEKQYHAYERLSRGSAGLASAQAEPYHVWLEDWSVNQTGPTTYQLHAAQDNFVIDLQLEDLKGPVLQGDKGFSRKGEQPGQASYYFSQTRLASKGTVTIKGDNFSVTGLSWMDHEYSTSYLSRNQVGWDWFALQLQDNHEVMLFQLRTSAGSNDPASSGTWIDIDSSTIPLSQPDFKIEVLDTWKSPHSKASYPSRWRVIIPSVQLDVEVVPVLQDQELNVSYSYWEGAVSVSGTHMGSPVEGQGYVELTGYAASMGGNF